MRPFCFDPDSSVRGSEAMQVVGGGEQVNHNLLQVLNIPNHKNEILLLTLGIGSYQEASLMKCYQAVYAWSFRLG